MSEEDIDKGTEVEADTPDVEEAGGAEEESPAAAEEPTELESARTEAAASQDRYLRAAAELDNFRKRTVKMRSETRDDTLRDVLLQVGPMLDNFRRALGQETEDVGSFRQGMEIIFKQFTDILGGYGLIEIEAEGQPFDPNLHEALVQVPSDEHPAGTVIQEMEKGYRLNDRVVRPSRVVVSAAKADSDQQVDSDQQADSDGKA